MRSKHNRFTSCGVLPFKLDIAYEVITSRAGLSLFGEFIHGLKLPSVIDKYLPPPGSPRGYNPSAFVIPLILMLNAGGRALEDLREIKLDEGLRELLGLKVMPSTDAVGDWLRRNGRNGGLEGLDKVKKHSIHKQLRKEKIKDYTLDMDATGILAEKQQALMTYKGFRGYMPMVGHIAENGLVIGDEFREGNVAPATMNLEFLKYCESLMPKGKRIKYFRADSASYQANIFNHCEDTDKKFAIGDRIGRACGRYFEKWGKAVFYRNQIQLLIRLILMRS